MVEQISSIEKIEIMPVPDVKVERQLGLELLAGLQKTADYQFKGENDEAISWIALTYTHPEQRRETLENITKHKSFIENPEALYEKIISSLTELEKEVPAFDIEREVQKREGMLPTYKRQIEKSIDYFRPHKESTKIETVIVVPCDKLLPRIKAGRGITIGNTSFILSHTENLDNFDHEFLHSVINPVTEKFTSYFERQENREKIFAYTNGGIEGYGDYPVSILNEELINTYNENIKNGQKAITLKQIKQEFEKLTEEDFARIKNREIGSTVVQDSFQEYGSLKQLVSDVEQYFDKFIKDRRIIKNELRKRILNFYQRYEEERIANPLLTFEKYFSLHYRKILS